MTYSTTSLGWWEPGPYLFSLVLTAGTNTGAPVSRVLISAHSSTDLHSVMLQLGDNRSFHTIWNPLSVFVPGSIEETLDVVNLVGPCCWKQECVWKRLDDSCWFLTDIKGTSSVLYDVNKKHQVSLIRKKDCDCYCVYIHILDNWSTSATGNTPWRGLLSVTGHFWFYLCRYEQLALVVCVQTTEVNNLIWSSQFGGET